MSLIRNHHSYGIAGKTSLIAAWQRFGSGRVCRGEGKKFRTAWVWIPAREMLSLNCHLAGHCFQLGTEARAPTPGLRDMGGFTPECDWNRGRDLRGRGEQMSPARREQLLSALPGRSRPGRERCGAGAFSLSLVLARRERLRKVALAVSQKSPARPGVEGSGLPSSSPGCSPEGFSRDIPTLFAPAPLRAPQG